MLGQLVFAEDGFPTGEVRVWATPPELEVTLTARIQLGRHEHAWEVARVSGDEAVVAISIPPEGRFSNLQELAVSQVYSKLTTELPAGGLVEQKLELLTVVWTWGLDEAPVWWTQEQADEMWSSGVVGIEGPPGEGSSLPPNEVDAWMEANP